VPDHPQQVSPRDKPDSRLLIIAMVPPAGNLHSGKMLDMVTTEI